MQFRVNNSPFNEEQAELLNKVLPTLTDSQKVWLSGYLSASFSFAAANPETEKGTITKQQEQSFQPKEIVILYGSQTGNSHGLAKNAEKALKESGFKVKVSAMNDFKPNQLKKTEILLIIVSTHGEGDPPDNALTFYEFLHGKRAPKLDHLQFSVLALGDSSYEKFCQTGKDFDKRLEELGGTRLYPRFDCDVDFEEPASEWLDGVLGTLKKFEKIEVSPVAASLAAEPKTESAYSRSNPFKAEILENINLNGRGSNKETRHLELSLEGSNLTFQPGDSLGIYPENDPALVDTILKELPWGSDQSVTINKQGDILSLREALISHYEITSLSKPLLEKIAGLSTNGSLKNLLEEENGEKLAQYIKGRDLLDVIQDFGPWGNSAQEFVSILRKIPPRLYSIASSYKANPEEVHLTIGAVRYHAHGRERKGVCSTFVAERLKQGDHVRVFIQENENFRLPENPSTPIIMIGPGTGVAPFRAFLQEREETGATGKSWLFFGDQHFMTDFLYQTEWNQWLKDGVLTKLDVAFSRDQEEKIYVQHRMLEKSKEFFQWLEDGAAVYICGDEKRMAKDVHETIIQIIEKEGGLDREKAEDYLAAMQKEKRYQRDVY